MQNKQWQSLFTRYGFQMTSKGEELDVTALNEENIQFLKNLLEQLNVEFFIYDSKLIIKTESVSEENFVKALKSLTNSKTEMLYYVKELPLSTLDTYIAGIVTQLNRLECMTIISCDGHDKQSASIGFQNRQSEKKALALFDSIQLSYRKVRREIKLQVNRKLLPEFAERLSTITIEEAALIMKESNQSMSKEAFNKQLESLLNNPGVSGGEGQIRKHVIEEILPYVDRLTVDATGNILAFKKFGEGPTILLNAHLDTVEEIIPTREIIKENNIWSSTEGILGADDRAGINVILATAKTLTASDFKGTIKYIFTVEEEIGLVGAKEVSETFLWDVDMAFVIDRRGTSDIVTSKAGYIPFCSERFGREIERIAQRAGLSHWKTTAGGSSDTAVWASHGIQSVNLSAGYQFEHTDMEQLDVEANYGVYELLLELLSNSRRLMNVARVSRANHYEQLKKA